MQMYQYYAYGNSLWYIKVHLLYCFSAVAQLLMYHDSTIMSSFNILPVVWKFYSSLDIFYILSTSVNKIVVD